MRRPEFRHPAAASAGSEPRVSGVLFRVFARYTRWYLRRHFHSVRLHLDGWLPDNENSVPNVVFLNHASWWDPLVCLHLARQLFSRHEAFAPIDARAVEKYGFFRHLGFFGVEPDSRRGAARFLRVASAVLGRPWRMLWITPQGRFCDIREGVVDFKPGLGHLASRIGRSSLQSRDRVPLPPVVRFLPLAIEYSYWQERLPEALLHFGSPIDVSAEAASSRSPEVWTRLFEHALDHASRKLARASIARDSDAFLHLLRGRSGVGGVYDGWRRLAAAARGQTFDPRHGRL